MTPEESLVEILKELDEHTRNWVITCYPNKELLEFFGLGNYEESRLQWYKEVYYFNRDEKGNPSFEWDENNQGQVRYYDEDEWVAQIDLYKKSEIKLVGVGDSPRGVYYKFSISKVEGEVTVEVPVSGDTPEIFNKGEGLSSSVRGRLIKTSQELAHITKEI